jgi:hypothetical protein
LHAAVVTAGAEVWWEHRDAGGWSERGGCNE